MATQGSGTGLRHDRETSLGRKIAGTEKAVFL